MTSHKEDRFFELLIFIPQDVRSRTGYPSLGIQDVKVFKESDPVPKPPPLCLLPNTPQVAATLAFDFCSLPPPPIIITQDSQANSAIHSSPSSGRTAIVPSSPQAPLHVQYMEETSWTPDTNQGAPPPPRRAPPSKLPKPPCFSVLSRE